MKIETPRRVVRSYSQTINGTPEDIFPLYCPVKEKEWCEGWDPLVVYTNSGLNEPDCVFITQDQEKKSTWFVTQFDFATGYVEMIKHTPKVSITKLDIQLEPVSGKETKATIRYGITALGPEGDAVLAHFTKENYITTMKAWEKAMNHFLKTGVMLQGLPWF